MAAPTMGVGEPCIKHENRQGREFCMEVVKSPIVDNP